MKNMVQLSILVGMLCFPVVMVLPSTYAWVKEMEDKHLFQGDMILSPDQRIAIESGKQNTYGAIIGKRWPKVGQYAIVPYDYAEDIRSVKSAIQGIEIAITDYEKYTCIRFKRRTGDELNYIKFVGGAGCASSVGMQRKPQKVHIGYGCRNKATVIHEIGHALGLWHEQSRPDRDQFLKIQWENIQEIMKFNFKKQPSSNVDSLGSPYDYRSVMHYAQTAFGGSSVTIKTLDPYYQNIIGTGTGFSREDIKQLNAMYKCHPYIGSFPTRQPTNKCYDLDKRCYIRVAENGCNDKRIRSLCRFTCNICATEHGTNPLPTFPSVTIPYRWTAPTTKDPNPHCPPDVWVNCKDVKSYCHNIGSWGERMKKNCKKTCNFCGSSTPTSQPSKIPPAFTTKVPSKTLPPPVTMDPSCKDTISNCKDLKAFCNTAGWELLKKRCKQTCKFC